MVGLLKADSRRSLANLALALNIKIKDVKHYLNEIKANYYFTIIKKD
jgi:hypothetical protein